MNEYEKTLIEMGVIDTSLTEGCIRHSILGKDYGFILKNYTGDTIVVFSQYSGEVLHLKKKKIEIFGHPLYIGAVMQWIRNNRKNNTYKREEDVSRRDYFISIIDKRGKDLSLPFHQIPEDRQKRIVDLFTELAE